MPNDVTQIIQAMQQGSTLAAESLLPLVYDELHRLAASKMKHERAGHTLQPTALVHEAFLRLVGDGDWRSWEGRAHFFAAAGEAMRRILIENARRRNAEKRGGGMERVELREDEHAAVAQPESLIELDAALSRLAQVDPELVRVVELRYFTGFTVEQTALALGLSERTIKRHWAYARAWLARELSDDPS